MSCSSACRSSGSDCRDLILARARSLTDWLIRQAVSKRCAPPRRRWASVWARRASGEVSNGTRELYLPGCHSACLASPPNPSCHARRHHVGESLLQPRKRERHRPQVDRGFRRGGPRPAHAPRERRPPGASRAACGSAWNRGVKISKARDSSASSRWEVCENMLA